MVADVTEVLCELELTIKKVKVSTTPDGKVIDLFFIIDTRFIFYIFFPVIVSLYLLKLVDLLIKTADELEGELILNENMHFEWKCTVSELKKHVVTREIMCKIIVILMAILLFLLKNIFEFVRGNALILQDQVF